MTAREGTPRDLGALLRRWLVRMLAVAVLAALAWGGWRWWRMQEWRPDPAAYPVQGVEVGAADGALDWTSLAAIGARFAYIDASNGARGRDPRFSANLEGARAAGLRVGAVHRYDACLPADTQAANFVTVVPRDADLLPAAVDLDRPADACTENVSDAAVESELMVFLNQIELHTGRAVILKVSRAFEERYHVAARFDRKLWLVSDRAEPDYAPRGWTLWTANTAYANELTQGGLRWIAAHPEEPTDE